MTAPAGLQVLLEKARAKGKQDNTFTESVLQKLFCNIEDILALHRRLLSELRTCVKGGVSYSSPIAGGYLKFVSVYRTHAGHSYLEVSAGANTFHGRSYLQNVFL